MTYISRPVASPNVCMRNEAKDGIRSAPFRLSEEEVGLEHRQSFNYPAQPFGQDQALEVANDRLPRLVVPVRQDIERYLIRKEAILGRDLIIAQPRYRREHFGDVSKQQQMAGRQRTVYSERIQADA